jgi:ankyrin repeat protein
VRVGGVLHLWGSCRTVARDCDTHTGQRGALGMLPVMKPPSVSSKDKAVGALAPRPKGTAAGTAGSKREQALKAQQAAALIDAVMTSVRTGNDEQVRALLEAGADVDSKDVEGRTPLIITARDNRPTTTKLLLSQNANVNAKTKLGATALIGAATHGHTGALTLPHSTRTKTLTHRKMQSSS